MLRSVEPTERPALDEALAAVASLGEGTALVWEPGRSLEDCEFIEYEPERLRLEVVTGEP